MVKNNRTCIICNKPYHYCPTCGSDSEKPSWYLIFDGENCHDIYETCVIYRDKAIDKKQAYEKVSKLDVSELDNFAEATKSQIKEILSYKIERDTDEKPKIDSVIKTNNTKKQYK